MFKKIKNINSKLFVRFFDLQVIERSLNRIKTAQYENLISKGNNTLLRETARIINPTQNKAKIFLGNNVLIDGELHVFNYGGRITIGDYTYVGNGSRIWSGESISIGSNVLISHNVGISDTSAHEFNFLERSERYKDLLLNGFPKDKAGILTASIVIEDFVWINFNSIILKGVRIGKGAIIAAGSVVTKNVPSFTLVAGNPARVVKHLEVKE